MKKDKIVYMLVAFALLLALSFSSLHLIEKTTDEVVKPEEGNETELQEALACVITYNGHRDNITSGAEGTGFFVNGGNDVKLISAQHVFEGKENIIIMERCKDENLVVEKSLMYNEFTDIAILELKNRSMKDIYSYSNSTIEEGDRVFYSGFRNEELIHDGGIVKETHFNIKNRENPAGLHKASIDNPDNVKGGISGGPVFDENGSVVGLISMRHNESLVFVDYRVIEGVYNGLDDMGSNYAIPEFSFGYSFNIGDNHVARSDGFIITEINRDFYYSKFTEPRMKIKNTQNNTVVYDFGDVVTQVNGRSFDSKEELRIYLIKNYVPGDQVSLTVVDSEGHQRREVVDLVPR